MGMNRSQGGAKGKLLTAYVGLSSQEVVLKRKKDCGYLGEENMGKGYVREKY